MFKVLYTILNLICVSGTGWEHFSLSSVFKIASSWSSKSFIIINNNNINILVLYPTAQSKFLGPALSSLKGYMHYMNLLRD